MYFLCKAHYSLLVLRDTREHLSTIMEGHLKQWDHRQKEQGMKNMALNQKAKRTCLWYECWNKKTYHLFNLSCENVHWAIQIFSHFAQNQEWLQCVVQSLSHVRFLATPWTAAHQASPSFTIYWGLLKTMSIESVMPSNSFIICHPLFLLPTIFPLWCKNCG